MAPLSATGVLPHPCVVQVHEAKARPRARCWNTTASAVAHSLRSRNVKRLLDLRAFDLWRSPPTAAWSWAVVEFQGEWWTFDCRGSGQKKRSEIGFNTEVVRVSWASKTEAPIASGRVSGDQAQPNAIAGRALGCPSSWLVAQPRQRNERHEEWEEDHCQPQRLVQGHLAGEGAPHRDPAARCGLRSRRLRCAGVRRSRSAGLRRSRIRGRDRRRPRRR